MLRKHTHTLSFLLFTAVKSEKPVFVRLENLARSIFEQKINQTQNDQIDFGFRMIGNPGSLFNSIVNFKDIDEYGCWCKLAQAGKGFGTAVDGIDSACKVFQHCRRCINIEANDDSCDPVSQNYGIGAYFSSINILGQCIDGNPGNVCAQHTCSCEVQFVTQLMDILFSYGNGYTADFNHKSGFDVDESCQIWVTGEKNWECCGTTGSHSLEFF